MRKNHIKLIKSIIRKAGKKDAWEFSNDVLYNLCKKYPENLKEEIVISSQTSLLKGTRRYDLRLSMYYYIKY